MGHVAVGCRAAALPLADGVPLGLGKFNRLLDIDYVDPFSVAQPGSPSWQ